VRLFPRPYPTINTLAQCVFFGANDFQEKNTPAPDAMNVRGPYANTGNVFLMKRQKNYGRFFSKNI